MIRNMKNLVEGWHKNADPLFAMKNRTGFPLESVSSLSVEEKATLVFGDEVAGRILRNGKLDVVSPMQSALMDCWLTMQLRQQNWELHFPIEVGEEYHFPVLAPVRLTGHSLIQQVGQQISCSYDSFLTDEEGEETEGKVLSWFDLTANVRAQADLAARVALSYDQRVLTFASAKRFVEETYGEIPNLTYVHSDWLRWGNFAITSADVLYVANRLATVLNRGKHRPFAVEENVIVLDNTHRFEVSEEGVFETARNRRFNNLLMVDSLTGRNEESTIHESQLTLLNSFGCFLYGLLYLGAPYLNQSPANLGQMVKQLTNGITLPMTSDDEVSPGDADRVSYERYVTGTRPAPDGVPFSFACMGDNQFKCVYTQKVEMGAASTYDEETGEYTKGYSAPPDYLVDRAALMQFNLVRMPAGYLIDGRRSCIQARHIPAQYREDWVKSTLEGAGLTTPEQAIEHFKLDKVPAASVYQYLGEHLIVGLSSKLAKLIKRTAMDAALVSEVVNGESRRFKRFGQKGVSKNNILIEACISAHAVFPPGIAAYWGEDLQMVVDHSEGFQPNLSGTRPGAEAVVVEFPRYAQEPAEEDGWIMVRYSRPIPTNVGTVVAYVPFETEQGEFQYPITTSVPDAQLVGIKWRYATVAGQATSLQIKVLTQTIETEVKGRNTIKAMMTRYLPEVIHNESNEPLLARSVFFRDTNKWLDLVMQHADIAACTAIKNADPVGLQLVQECNALAGVSTSEYLVWSPVLATMGAYQPLLDWFEATFGRAIWYEHRTVASEWVRVIREIYFAEGVPTKGWHVVRQEGVQVTIADGDPSDPKTNVLLFDEEDGEYIFKQRAWSYCGTPKTGAVYQPIKAELSSVRAAVGTTPLMAGVARYIEQRDPQYAQALVRDGKHHAELAACFYAMVRNNSIVKDGAELPVYDLETAAPFLQTEERQALVLDPANQGNLLTLLEPKFGKALIRVNTVKGAFTLYIPAIAMQDRNQGFKSAEGLSDLVTRVLVQVILGVDQTKPQFVQLLSRVRSALVSLCESEGLAKAATLCRLGVQAKVKALPVVPLSEVWVRQSVRFNSVYQTMKRVFGKEPDGTKVILMRAPMTTPIVVKVKVITDDHASAELVGEDTILGSPLLQILNGGDYDGDGITVVDASDSHLPLAQLTDLVNNVVDRTGDDQLSPGAAYWGDHYEIPSYASIQKKRKLSTKNLSLDTGECLDKHRDSLPVMLSASTKTFQYAVGSIHRLFLGVDLLTSMSWSLQGKFKSKFAGWKPYAFTRNESITLISAENYEVPLGGLDWGAYDVFYKTIIPRLMVHTDIPLSVKEKATFEEHLRKASMNADAAADISSSNDEIAVGLEMSRPKKDELVIRCLKDPNRFLNLCAEISALLSKGDFIPTRNPQRSKAAYQKAHLLMMKVFLQWVEQNDPDHELINSSIVLVQLWNYVSTQWVAVNNGAPSVSI